MGYGVFCDVPVGERDAYLIPAAVGVVLERGTSGCLVDVDSVGEIGRADSGRGGGLWQWGAGEDALDGVGQRCGGQVISRHVSHPMEAAPWRIVSPARRIPAFPVRSRC